MLSFEESDRALLEQDHERLRYALERRHRCDTCGGTGTDWYVDEEGEVEGEPCECWILAEEVLSNGQITAEGPETVWCCQAMVRAVGTDKLLSITPDNTVSFPAAEAEMALRYCPFCGCRLLRKIP